MLVSSYGYRKGRGGGGATYKVATPKSIGEKSTEERPNDLHKADEKNHYKPPNQHHLISI
jgi:hypothetical protein